MNWYARVTRKMHFDMHTPAVVEDVGIDFDAERLAEELEAAGVEAICFFAKCAYGWSYYPTRVGRRHPNLATDTFPPAVDACHRRGIRVLGYYHISGCEWAGDHPEWHGRNADGSSQGDGSIPYSLCPIGPAGDELIIPQLVEIVTLQPADGLFLDDLIGWKTCYCESCRAAFGRAMPAGPADDGWDDYLAWRREAASAFFGRAAAAVHAARPDALFGVNYAGSYRHPDFLPPGLDYLTADVPEPESSSLNASLLLRQHATQPLPYDAMNSRMVHWWADWTQKPVTAIRQEFATVLASGGMTFLGDICYHRTAMPDPAVLANAGRAFSVVREMEPWIHDTEAVPDIAILNSAASHYRSSRSPNADPIPVKGAHLALLEAGMHTHILTEASLPERLPAYRCLVVSEQARVSERTCDAIREFVRAGGGLVVLGDSPLADILGIERIGLFEDDRGYFTCDAPDLSPRDEAASPPRLVHGQGVRVRPTSAEVLAPHIAPLGGGPPHSGPPPAEPSGDPAVTISHYGDGRAALVALPVATDYFARGHAALAPLIAGLVRRVCTPLVEVRTSAPVEVSLRRRGSSLLVHLVNYTASRHPGRPATIDHITPVHEVAVRLRLAGEPRLAGGSDETWVAARVDGGLDLVLPRLELWACAEVSVADAL